MPTRQRTRKQVRSDRAALKKLKASGLIKGKIDLRRAPSRARRAAINRFSDVIAGKARAVRPRDPNSYKGAFPVVGNVVIVPRRKGEKIGLSKTGKITRTRKVGGRKVKSTIIRTKPGTRIPPPPKGSIVFRVPFRRGSGKDQKTEYRRFTGPQLAAFLEEYADDPETADDWMDHIEVEQFDDPDYEKQLDRYIIGEYVPKDEPSQLAPKSIADRALAGLRRRMQSGEDD